MPVGKRSHCRNHANQLIVDFADAGDLRFSLILRAYDEGVAYRYRIHGSGEDTVIGEASAFRVPVGSCCWSAPFSKSYESIYQEHDGFADIRHEIQFPLLFRFPGRQWVYLTEAEVDGSYAGACVKALDAGAGLLGLQLAEQPTAALPWTTPWRVLMVVDDLRHLVESTLINNLNPPSAIPDTSWIKPGTTILPWLTGTEGGGGPSQRNNNGSLERMKEFVDLAATMGWTWIEFDNALALDTPFGGAPEKWMDMRIAADPLTVDPSQPLVITMPPNGGFGFRIVNGAKNIRVQSTIKEILK
jgi:alpha-glucosidase